MLSAPFMRIRVNSGLLLLCFCVSLSLSLSSVPARRIEISILYLCPGDLFGCLVLVVVVVVVPTCNESIRIAPTKCFCFLEPRHNPSTDAWICISTCAQNLVLHLFKNRFVKLALVCGFHVKSRAG